jgi:hypothetical protein
MKYSVPLPVFLKLKRLLFFLKPKAISGLCSFILIHIAGFFQGSLFCSENTFFAHCKGIAA